ncbi:unnamed protein product [Chilo suppressalis]|uniref:DUF4806 domain-containing protein n=1 Tax=Chilo suppressalis TaxID=168631 RepID=A0ABN8B7I5_CHISP|nr:unnamed protein product [Chilo suppressalis]
MIMNVLVGINPIILFQTMPFKIVQTVEKGRPTLSIVPYVWEDDGKLFWPTEKVKNRARLARDENSFPNPNWDILDCVVKRSNIATYAEAQNELRIMENYTDTDNETSESRPSPAPVRPAAIPPANRFENMVQNLMPSAINAGATSNQIEANDEMSCLTFFDGEQCITNQNILIQKVNNQELILQNLVESVQKLTQKVSELSVQLDECMLKFVEKIEQPVSVTLLNDANQVDKESFIFKQISDKQQLDNLERSLINKTERSKLQQQLGFLFQPCEGNGLTFAYKLIDSMVSREFLCECSWSGGSRGNVSKVPIKDYKNFVKFFCDMIRSWDCKFTMGQTEKFFKVILKNAVKRKSMKDLRSSSKRVRKIKSKPKDQASTSKQEVSADLKINQNKESNETLEMEIAEVEDEDEESLR